MAKKENNHLTYLYNTKTYTSPQIQTYVVYAKCENQLPANSPIESTIEGFEDAGEW